jgi:peptidoglycan DL-endopeptidase LytF
MTRKDTILIAVVINAGLLAILFTTAVIYDTDKGIEQTEFAASLVDGKTIQGEPHPILIASASSGDEVDNVLKYYSQPSSQPIINQESYAAEPILVQSVPADDDDPIQESPLSSQIHFVEVKVKNGDMLEKIARANKTTVGAIKRLNHLPNEFLHIGQVLKIPVNQEAAGFAHAAAMKNQDLVEEIRQDSKKDHESQEAVYYVIKSGDNPWKVAKRFNVKFEDILKLNHLNEEKARNLKIGDRIRVK